MAEQDEVRPFADEDEPPLPAHRVAWRPALLVALAVTLVTLTLTIVLAAVFGLEARERGEAATSDDAALFGLSVVMLAVHAVLLRFGLARLAGYDIGLGWALLAAVLANVLANLLFVVGLIVSVPVQAAVIRRRSEPRPSLVGR